MWLVVTNHSPRTSSSCLRHFTSSELWVRGINKVFSFFIWLTFMCCTHTQKDKKCPFSRVVSFWWWRLLHIIKLNTENKVLQVIDQIRTHYQMVALDELCTVCFIKPAQLTSINRFNSSASGKQLNRKSGYKHKWIYNMNPAHLHYEQSLYQNRKHVKKYRYLIMKN